MIREPGPEWLIIPKAIRALVQRIVERFQPEKVILFGSYADLFLREVTTRGKVLYERTRS